KHSTQKNHRHITDKHLVPRFGERQISDITRRENRSRRTTYSASRVHGLQIAWAYERDVAHASTDVLVMGTRERRARQSRGAVDGSREGRHDVERVHAGDRRRAAHGGGQGRIRIVHNCSPTGKDERANSLKRLAPQAGLEPATLRLTAECSAIELVRNTAGRAS